MAAGDDDCLIVFFRRANRVGADMQHRLDPGFKAALLQQCGKLRCIRRRARDEQARHAAQMTTKACASGYSSLNDSSMRAVFCGGVIACSRSSALPCSMMPGLPDGSL